MPTTGRMDNDNRGESSPESSSPTESEVAPLRDSPGPSRQRSRLVASPTTGPGKCQEHSHESEDQSCVTPAGAVVSEGRLPQLAGGTSVTVVLIPEAPPGPTRGRGSGVRGGRGGRVGLELSWSGGSRNNQSAHQQAKKDNNPTNKSHRESPSHGSRGDFRQKQSTPSGGKAQTKRKHCAATVRIRGKSPPNGRLGRLRHCG